MNDWRPPCMGGWCHVRDVCQRYVQTHGRYQPVERLCSKGGQEHFVRIVRQEAA